MGEIKGSLWTLVLASTLAMVGHPVAEDIEFVVPDPPGGSGQVISGAEVTDPQTWPSTFIFRSGSGGCTSTVVGQRVVLTAAHCIPHQASGTVQTQSGPVKVKCFHHPGYDLGNISTDFALCAAETKFSGFPFETISTSLALPKKGDKVTLIGYGCTTEGGQDHHFGKLYLGVSTVDGRPSGDNVYTVTRGGAAVCFGDSGGAAYFRFSNNRRVIIGVNSRGDISNTSWLSTTASALFVDWAQSWSGERGVSICGVDASAANCR